MGFYLYKQRTCIYNRVRLGSITSTCKWFYNDDVLSTSNRLMWILSTRWWDFEFSNHFERWWTWVIMLKGATLQLLLNPQWIYYSISKACARIWQRHVPRWLTVYKQWSSDSWLPYWPWMVVFTPSYKCVK